MGQSRHKVLIIGPTWVGDMIMSQSLFITLKNQDTNVIIDVLAPDWTKPLLARMPEVNKAIAMDIKHGEIGWRKRKLIGRQLRSESYDQCIVIPNTLKSALIPYFSHIPKRTGWLKEPRFILLNDLRRFNKKKYPLMLQKLNALAFEPKAPLPEKLPYPLLAIDNSEIEAARYKHKLDSNKRVIVLCPGAEFGASKRWPVNHYAALAERYLTEGWQVWLFGSQNDYQICDSIDRATQSKCNNLAGATTLAEAIDLMSLASLVVSNDSGLMHMAAALRRPLVAIYGSTSTDFTPPLSDRCLVVKKQLECAPCFKRECPLGHHNCMKQLTPEVVLNRIRDNADLLDINQIND